MAEQSPVQQLIQSLAGIQTTAQQNASNAANNGNPNTVYNTSTWGYGGPPVSNADGQFSSSTFSPAAVLQAQNLNLGGWAAPQGTTSDLSRLMPQLPAGGVVTTPGWSSGGGNNGGGGTTTPPTTTPPTSTPVTGGNGGAGVTDYPLWNGPGGTWSPPGGIKPGNVSNGGTGSNWQGTSVGEWLTTGRGGQLLGMNPDGSISWQQVVDLVSEPWVQGNLYMSNTGRWNAQNIVEALANTIIPGSGNLLETLASNGVFGEQVRQWAIEGRLAEAENTMIGMMEELEAFDRADGTNYTGTNPYAGLQIGNPALDPFLSNITRGNTAINNVLNGAATNDGWVENELAQWDTYQSRGSGRDNRSGRSAGSSTLAEGEAAQDLVNQWQINQWLQGSSAQARSAMERMFGGSYK